ncbi:predicted protein (fragment) [Azospirillum baldaniorum]|uniref:Uncharacterized protein n=1 Tax=Azospirillum baldaniorum TaxID=1064539 RepID=A0A9P1JST5_9PROT
MGKGGAGGRTRTDISVRTADFESAASTNSATPARCLPDPALVATGARYIEGKSPWDKVFCADASACLA